MTDQETWTQRGVTYPFEPCAVGNPRFGRVGMTCDLSDQAPCIGCGEMCCTSCKMHVVTPEHAENTNMAGVYYRHWQGKVGRVCVRCHRDAEDMLRMGR